MGNLCLSLGRQKWGYRMEWSITSMRYTDTPREATERTAGSACTYKAKEQGSSSRAKVSGALPLLPLPPRTAAIAPTSFLSKGWGTHKLPEPLQQTGHCGISYHSAPCPREWGSHSSQSAQCSTFLSFWMTSVFRLCLQRKKSYYFCSKSSFLMRSALPADWMSSVCCLSCKFCLSQRCLAAPDGIQTVLPDLVHINTCPPALFYARQADAFSDKESQSLCPALLLTTSALQATVLAQMHPHVNELSTNTNWAIKSLFTILTENINSWDPVLSKRSQSSEYKYSLAICYCFLNECLFSFKSLPPCTSSALPCSSDTTICVCSFHHSLPALIL